MSECEILVKKLSDTAVIPKFMHGITDAACDLYANENVTIRVGETSLVHTGLAISFPENMVACVCSRSGLAKDGITVANAPGIVDSSYRGDVGVLLVNNGDYECKIEAGERIAQLMFLPVIHPTFTVTDVLPESSRGNGGFGSTGKD